MFTLTFYTPVFTDIFRRHDRKRYDNYVTHTNQQQVLYSQGIFSLDLKKHVIISKNYLIAFLINSEDTTIVSPSRLKHKIDHFLSLSLSLFLFPSF